MAFTLQLGEQAPDFSLPATGRGVDNPRETAKMTVNDLDNALRQRAALG